MEIDRLLLSPAMYTFIEHDFCTTCYERPPVLSDRFCWAEGVVAQDRFYCSIKTGKMCRAITQHIFDLDLRIQRIHSHDHDGFGGRCRLITRSIGLLQTTMTITTYQMLLVIDWSNGEIDLLLEVGADVDNCLLTRNNHARA